MNEKKLSKKEIEQLLRFRDYLYNALDTLISNSCFSSNKALCKWLSITNKKDIRDLELNK